MVALPQETLRRSIPATAAATPTERRSTPYNIKDFGAVGTGLVDSTAAVQAALNLGDIFVPSGTFMCGTLSIPSGRSITGEGYSSCIKAKAVLNTWLIQNTDLVPGNTDIHISFIRVDGNKAEQTSGSAYGIYFSRVTNGSVSNVTMENCRQDGFLAGSSAGGTNCIGIVVRNCVVRNCDRNGLAAVACTDSEFSHNTIYGSGAALENAGIDIEPDNSTVSVSRFRVIGNRVDGYGSASVGAVGIVIDNGEAATCEDHLIADNLVSNCGGMGIQVSRGVVGASVVGNTVVGNGRRTASADYGIFISSCPGTMVASNRVRNHGNATSGGPGIFTLLSDGIIVSNNLVDRSFGAGISIRGSLDGNIVGNICASNGRVSSNSYSGIELVTASAIVPSGNIITGNKCYDEAGVAGDQKYGIECTNSSGNQISGNDLRGNRTGPILNNATDDFIRGNAGLNPVGHWATPPAVPASGAEVTNTSSYDCMVVIQGGGGLFINVGGVQISALAGTENTTEVVPIQVSAGQAIGLVYSTAPTWRWFRL